MIDSELGGWGRKENQSKGLKRPEGLFGRGELCKSLCV